MNRVAIVNSPVGIGPNGWAECWVDAAAHAPLFGVNENLTRAQRLVYRELAREFGLEYHGMTTPNPVFWAADLYDFQAGEVHELHDAATGPLAERFPGFNAGRSLTEVVLKRKRDGQEVAVLNTHWVPRGPKVNARWRRQMRRKSKALLRYLVRKHVREGREVWVIGDFNLAGPFPMRVAEFRWVRAQGVDKVGVAVPKGQKPVGRKRRGFRLVRTASDHGHLVAAQADTRAA